MRWATAKLDELKTQVEEVREALMACSGAQETEVGRSLLQRLCDHTTSLEVTAALRQPAVQPRHWQHLVTVAGKGDASHLDPWQCRFSEKMIRYNSL